jgi:DNA-3-methyladenine glycosylase
VTATAPAIQVHWRKLAVLDLIAALRAVRLSAEEPGATCSPSRATSSAAFRSRRAGIIVETEAISARRSASPRFDRPSHERVRTRRRLVRLLCYGIHEMFNIVTGEDGQGQAVLIRAIAPYLGLPDDPHVGRGPGKVTTALGIDRSLDRKNLAKGPLFVAQGLAPTAIATGPRVGVAYAKEWAEKPYRFWWRDHASVSRPAAGAARSTEATIRKR